nr:trafficking regulator of GLUT4 1-like [Anolis sagrei ordinatus]
MSHPKYTRMEDDTSDVLNPPPYSNASDGPMPPQYQPYYNPPGARINSEPVFQSSQTIVTHGQTISEPDYMAYSIFTILCCCLPLGIAALVYSVKTQEANRVGNKISAQKNSRLARNLAHTALGIGLTFLIVYIILFVINSTKIRN